MINLKKIASTLIAIMLSASCAITASADRPAEHNNIPLGQSGYVHLNKYAEPAGDAIWKITLSLSGSIIYPTTDIVFVLDNTGSMATIPDDIPNFNDDSYTFLGLRVPLGGTALSSLSPLNSTNSTKTTLAQAASNAPCANDIYIGHVPGAIADWFSQAAGYSTGSDLLDQYDDGGLYDWNNRTNFRHEWAREGAKSAVDILLDPSKNPGADKTKVAIVAYDTTVTLDTRVGMGAYTSVDTTGFAPKSSSTSAQAATDLKNILDNEYNRSYGRTDIGLGMAKAYDIMKNSTADKKIIVLLTDGNWNEGDCEYPERMLNLCAAFKAPNTIVPASGTLSGVAFGGSSFMGMNGQIMTINLSQTPSALLGTSNTNFKNSGAPSAWGIPVPASVPGPIPISTINSPTAEQLLVAMSAGLNPSAYTGAAYSSIGAAWADFLANANDKPSYVYNTAYEFIDSRKNPASAVTQVFERFANNIVSVGGNPVVTDFIGSQFSLYQMPGQPLFQTSQPAPMQTVSVSGKTITWKMQDIPIMSAHTLVYYVKMDTSTSQNDLWYYTNEPAYLEYTNVVDENALKWFPEPIVNYQKTPTPSDGGFYKPTTTPTTNTFPPEAYPYGSPIPKYTPSVPMRTSVPSVTVAESIDEGSTDPQEPTQAPTEENNPPSVPSDTYAPEDLPPMAATGENSVTAAFVFAALAVCAFVIIRRSRAKK